MKLKAKELRRSKPDKSNFEKVRRNPIYFVLDNVIDTYNIGSLFRLSDALAVEKMFICGKTEYPPSSRIHKAAVGTEAWVPWEKEDKTENTIKMLKEDGVFIIAVEQDKKSISIKDLGRENIKFPLAIVVGNETYGISKKVLALSDIAVELPMFGINNSFNVWGSAAVVGYKIAEIIEE